MVVTYSAGAQERQEWGVRNFPEDCPVHSLLESETNQASRENLVQEKGLSSPGLWPPYTNPVQRGVHVPGPDHLPEPWREAGASQPGRSPPSAAGPQSPAAAYSPSRVERGGAR